MEIINEKAAKIRLLLLDVDGVLTDRKIYFTDTGHEYKAFNLHDGLGIKLLIRSGVEVGIVTSRQSSIVQKRMQELGVKYVYQGQSDKNIALEHITQTLKLSLSQVAYAGDDLPDLPVIRKVGLGIAVADATKFVRHHADYCTQLVGGQGAVREICELIMQSQGTLNTLYEQYL